MSEKKGPITMKDVIADPGILTRGMGPLTSLSGDGPDHPMDPELDEHYEKLGELVEQAPPGRAPPTGTTEAVQHVAARYFAGYREVPKEEIDREEREALYGSPFPPRFDPDRIAIDKATSRASSTRPASEDQPQVPDAQVLALAALDATRPTLPVDDLYETAISLAREVARSRGLSSAAPSASSIRDSAPDSLKCSKCGSTVGVLSVEVPSDPQYPRYEPRCPSCRR